MNWEEKVWGRVQHVFVDEHAAVSELEVVEGFRCSIHFHHHRINQFVVTEGKIEVVEFSNQVLVSRRKMLDPGDIYIVTTGVWHYFRVLESGRVIENYWSDGSGPVSIDDIERFDTGGKDDLG